MQVDDVHVAGDMPRLALMSSLVLVRWAAWRSLTLLDAAAAAIVEPLLAGSVNGLPAYNVHTHAFICESQYLILPGHGVEPLVHRAHNRLRCDANQLWRPVATVKDLEKVELGASGKVEKAPHSNSEVVWPQPFIDGDHPGLQMSQCAAAFQRHV